MAPRCVTPSPFLGRSRGTGRPTALDPNIKRGVIIPSEPSAVWASRSTNDNPVTLQTIQDGTSNTMLVGEKWCRPDQYAGGAWNDDHAIISGLDQDGVRLGDRKPIKDTTAALTWTPTIPAATGGEIPRIASRRPDTGVVSAANTKPVATPCFGDGSVKIVAWNVTDAVWTAICDRQDGVTYHCRNDHRVKYR